MSATLPEFTEGRQARPLLFVEHTHRFLQALWEPDDVREARILTRHGAEASGYFDDPGGLLRAVADWDGTANIYISLNPVCPELLDRAPNQMVRKPQKTTADADIVRRSWLFLDIDSVHPSGMSATDAELCAARKLLDRLTESLRAEGWPERITCLSGNGCYALYRIDLPNTLDARKRIGRVLAGLGARYSTVDAHIDTNVANASRLVGLIGSLKMKGAPTEERPHRRSSLVNRPEALIPVPRLLLEAVAATTPPKPIMVLPEAAPLRELLDGAHVDYRERPEPDAQGIFWYQVRTCPFHGPEHPYECGVGQAEDGRYAGKCFHDESKGWREWKTALGLSTRRTPSRRGDVACQTAAETERSYARTDAGNAEFFTELFKDELRYDHRRKSWLIWDGDHWSYDRAGTVQRRAIEAARTRFCRSTQMGDLRDRQHEAQFAIQTENASRAEAMLRVAACLPPLAETGERWNQDPWLLGVANGVVDLQTGLLRPGQPEDNITLASDVPCLPDAPCPRWLQFLNEIFVSDQGLIDFVHRAVGYSLTGITSEQCLFMLHGSGANGKSLFLSVLRALLGTYAYNTPFSTFELTRRSDITNDLAALAGKRLVTSSETNEGARLNEARAKAITGCDPLTARFLYGENFTFRPVAKFFLAVNHLPVVTDDSYGFWRRVRLIPFTRQFTTDADPGLEEKLMAELPGTLAWAIAGCLAWQSRGLEPPESVRVATADYQEKSDVLGGFLAECLVTGDARSIGAAEAYGAYQTWARGQGMSDREMLTSTSFGSKMGDRFYGKKGAGGKRYFGVGLPGDPVQEVLG